MRFKMAVSGAAAVACAGVLVPVAAQAAVLPATCPTLASGTTVINKNMDGCNSSNVTIYQTFGHSSTYYGFYNSGGGYVESLESPKAIGTGTINYNIILSLISGTNFYTEQDAGGVSYSIHY